MQENWKDRTTRYNQEQQRAALEKQQDEARQKVEQEKRAIEGLSGIWQELDVEATLRKIRKEVWNRKGEIRVSDTPALLVPERLFYSTLYGKPPPNYTLLASLEFTWDSPTEPKFEPILERRFGFHKEPVYSERGKGDNMGGVDFVEVGERSVLGYHNVEIGRKGSYELKTQHEILSVELRGGFSTYDCKLFGSLWIHTRAPNVPREVPIEKYLERIQVLKELLDKAFLEDCVERTRLGYLPDVYIKEAKEKEDRLRLQGYSRV